MAQVEFVSTMRRIFWGWRVEVGEGEGARERLRAVVDASQPKITLQVRDPGGVRLRWVRR